MAPWTLTEDNLDTALPKVQTLDDTLVVLLFGRGTGKRIMLFFKLRSRKLVILFFYFLTIAIAGAVCAEKLPG